MRAAALGQVAVKMVLKFGILMVYGSQVAVCCKGQVAISYLFTALGEDCLQVIE